MFLNVHKMIPYGVNIGLVSASYENDVFKFAMLNSQLYSGKSKLNSNVN